jgi:hypothetical protein
MSKINLESLMKKTITIFISTLFSGSLLAAMLQVTSSKDNTLYETETGNLSNGSGTYSFIGVTGSFDGQNKRRALYKFDVSSIPDQSVINSVSVNFTISKTSPAATTASADLHLVLTDWGEGSSFAGGPGGGGAASTTNDATWIHAFFESQLWTTPGGDFNPTSSATITYGTVNQVINFQSNNSLIADVQIWLDTPENNFGWIMLGDENNSQNARRLNTHENNSGQPELIIDYTPPDPIFANGFE